MALGMGGKAPKMITSKQPASAYPKPRGPKVKDRRTGTEPDKTNTVSYPSTKVGKSMAGRAASTSWATLLHFTNGGKGSYTGGKGK